MGRIIVARHGRTSWNAAGRFQGHGDPPLDEVGEEQARALAAALAVLDPPVVVTSDLRRARQTAEMVAGACGADLVVDPALREMDLGTWEALTPAEVEDRFPEEYRRWRAGEDVARGGGETRVEAASRVTPVLLALAASAAPGRPPVVVAHGLVLQAAMAALAGAGALPASAAGAAHLGNAEWVELDLDAAADPTPLPT